MVAVTGGDVLGWFVMVNVHIIRVAMVLAAGLGVVVFRLLHFPLPWLLGPMVTTLLLKLHYPDKVMCSIRFRNLVLIPLGYGVGTHVTVEACREMLNQSAGIIVTTFMSIALCVLLAWWTSRSADVSMQSSVLGSMPGGLTPMILISESIPHADINVVVMLQSLRLISTVFAIPFLVFQSAGVTPDVAQGALHLVTLEDAGIPLWQLILVAISGPVIGTFIRLPAKFLVGPVISTGIFAIYTGTPLPEAPYWLTSLAQVVTGVYLGTCIDPFQLSKNRRLLPTGIAGVVALIAGSLLMGYALSFFYGFSPTTAFLATAPGGVAEMCITGMVLGENVAVILAYQLFRLLFLCSVMPLVLQWYFSRKESIAG